MRKKKENQAQISAKSMNYRATEKSGLKGGKVLFAMYRISI